MIDDAGRQLLEIGHHQAWFFIQLWDMFESHCENDSVWKKQACNHRMKGVQKISGRGCFFIH